MHSFKFDLLVAAPAAKVFEALTTQQGIQSWWTTSSEVGTAVGEHITIRFGGTVPAVQLDALQPATEVRWRVVDAHLVVPGLARTNEWLGTTIVFQLVPESGAATRLALEHIGLTPQVECYDICSQGWAQFLESLKAYLETGKGTPYAEPGT